MKKFITLLLLVLFVSVNAYSQTAERKYEYAIVYYLENGKIPITISYGSSREEDFAATRSIKLKGHVVVDINYIVDAFNYMDEQGYELVSTTRDTWSSGGSKTLQYIFRKEIKK